MKFAADENFNNDVIRGLLRRKPDLDIVRIQDTAIMSRSDSTVLAWAAQEGRILLTHDVRTVTKYTYERVEAGLSMPGVFEVDDTMPLGTAIDDLLLLIECSIEGEWEGQVCYVPLH